MNCDNKIIFINILYSEKITFFTKGVDIFLYLRYNKTYLSDKNILSLTR